MKTEIVQSQNWLTLVASSTFMISMASIGRNEGIWILFSCGALFFASLAWLQFRKRKTKIIWNLEGIEIYEYDGLKYKGKLYTHFISNINSSVVELNLPNGLERLRIRGNCVSESFWKHLGKLRPNQSAQVNPVTRPEYPRTT